MHNQKILIVGASSFLAANVVSELLKLNQYEIHTVRRTAKDSKFELRTANHYLDYTNIKNLSQIISEIKPEIIFNCVAITSHAACEKDFNAAFEVNATFAKNLAKISSTIGAKLIHFSTDAVFDGLEGGYSEESCPNPFSNYGKTKLIGEQFVAKEMDNYLILRINFFGWSPSGNVGIFDYFLKNLIKNNKIFGYTDYITSSIYVTDLCKLLIKALDCNLNGLFHLASSNSLSKYEFSQTIASIFQLNGNLIEPVESKNFETLISKKRNLSLNVEKITKKLNISKIPDIGSGVLSAKMQLPEIINIWVEEEMDYRLDAYKR